MLVLSQFILQEKDRTKKENCFTLIGRYVLKKIKNGCTMKLKHLQHKQNK